MASEAGRMVQDQVLSAPAKLVQKQEEKEVEAKR